MITPSVSKKWGGTTTSVMNFYNGLSRHSDIACTVVTTVSKDEENEITEEIEKRKKELEERKKKLEKDVKKKVFDLIKKPGD